MRTRSGAAPRVRRPRRRSRRRPRRSGPPELGKPPLGTTGRGRNRRPRDPGTSRRQRKQRRWFGARRPGQCLRRRSFAGPRRARGPLREWLCPRTIGRLPPEQPAPQRVAHHPREGLGPQECQDPWRVGRRPREWPALWQLGRRRVGRPLREWLGPRVGRRARSTLRRLWKAKARLWLADGRLRASLRPRDKLGRWRSRVQRPPNAGVGNTRRRPHHRLSAERNSVHAPSIPMQWRIDLRSRRTDVRWWRTDLRSRRRLRASRSGRRAAPIRGPRRTSRRPRRCLGGWGMRLPPPVTGMMRKVRRRPWMTPGVRGVSRRPRTFLDRRRGGRCRRSSAEKPRIGPRRPGTGPPVTKSHPSRPSDGRSARIVRMQPPTRGRERTGPRTPPMGCRVRAPFHQLLTSGRGRTGLWPRPVETLPMIVLMWTVQRRPPAMSRGPSGGYLRRRRPGSGPIRRGLRQGRNGRHGRAPHRGRSRRGRTRQGRSHQGRTHQSRTCGLGLRRLPPHPLALRNLSIVLSCCRRFRPIRGVAGMWRGAGRAVHPALPTHRGTDPHRGTIPPTHAPGSRPLGRRATTAEHLHHERVKVPVRQPAEPSTRDPTRPRKRGGLARSTLRGLAGSRAGDPSCRR
jgi:hypothetical protein